MSPSTSRGVTATSARTRSGRSGAVAALTLVLLVLGALTLPGTTAVADHDRPETILVNGQPLHGEGSPHLEGCTLTVSVADLADAEHELSLSIALTEPSGSAVLVTDDAAFTGTGWEGVYPMDELVAEIPPKEHGHHVVITVVIDGVAQTSRPFWLACGADLGGNPFRLVFDKAWQTTEGEPLSGPPEVLDRAGYALDATSDRGSAHCTYPPDSDTLVCEYVNGHGHESETEALIVPAGKKFTFTVSETGLPEGWAPVSGVGTFAPREVCPFDGHDDEREARAEEGPREPCLWTVVNAGDLPEPTTTTTTTTTTTVAPSTQPTTPPSSGPTTAPAVVSPEALAATTVPAATLPVTGPDDSGLLTAVAAALIAGGSGAMVWARRRRALLDG